MSQTVWNIYTLDMDFISEIKRDNAEIINIVRSEVNEIASRDMLPMSESFQNDVDILSEYLEKPGRGIGGSLVLRMAGLLQSQPDRDIALRVAAATEIQNAALLIYDDWMDESAYRKKQPTVHERYAQRLPQASRSPEQHRHAAGSLTVMLGVVALSMSNIILTSRVYPQQGKIIRNLQTGALKVGSAGIIEQRLATDTDIQTEQNIMAGYSGKTGWYSYEAPMRSGLILAGADTDTTQTFSEIAQLLGLVFQMQDDVVGTFGDPEITGKPNTDDLHEGLYTLLIHLAYENLLPNDKTLLRQLHGRKDLTDWEIDAYRNLIAKSGADKIILDRTAHLLDTATDKLTTAWRDDWNPQVRNYLESVIAYLWAKNV